MTRIIVLIACALLLTGPLVLWGAESEPIVVIVNKNITIDSLTIGDLSKIYKGQMKTWPDGQRIFVIERPVDSRIRVWFYKLVLKAKPGKHFFKPGSPVPLKRMVSKSSLSATRMVSRIPNAIAYVYLRDVRKEQKILKIEGILPTERKYKLIVNP